MLKLWDVCLSTYHMCYYCVCLRISHHMICVCHTQCILGKIIWGTNKNKGPCNGQSGIVNTIHLTWYFGWFRVETLARVETFSRFTPWWPVHVCRKTICQIIQIKGLANFKGFTVLVTIFRRKTGLQSWMTKTNFLFFSI